MDTYLNCSINWHSHGVSVVHHIKGRACVEATWFVVLLWASLQTFSNHLSQFLPVDGIHYQMTFMLHIYHSVSFMNAR